MTQTINSAWGSAPLGSGCCFNHLLRAPAWPCWVTLGPVVPLAPVPWGQGCHAPAEREGFQLKFNATQSGLGPGPRVPAQRVCAHVWWLLLRDAVAVMQLLDVLELWQRGLCWVPVMRIPALLLPVSSRASAAGRRAAVPGPLWVLISRRICGNGRGSGGGKPDLKGEVLKCWDCVV